TATPALSGLTLDVHEGEILSVTGESGSGKTTLLRLIAGLEVPDSGRIEISGKTVCGPNLTPVVPEHRGVGMVFQSYALFPHLTIRDNVLYGLRTARPRKEREAILASVLGLTGLCGFEKRFPHEVSGGQQQRVALARALAPQPRIILLDEPFSNLDVTLRQQLREDVGRILRAARTTALLVTHDTRDALAISDRIAVMKNGQLQQLGTPREIYCTPANEMTAILFGRMNFLPPGALGHASADGPVWIRPEHLELIPAADSSTSGITGTIVRTHFYGDRQEVVIACNGPHGSTHEVAVLGDPLAAFKPGSRVHLREKNVS
ncbi:MAG: Ferric iron transporter, ATP-binding protein, partial [Verrucomicrobiales bacterium]|nr:Ferric iron transporter, ATP-binding protein [Verrucomicrobiales bacterium]